MARSGKYYEAGGARAERVLELFSRIAPRYDLINDLQSFGLHRWWKRRLVRLAQVPDGGRALDLCCGTGDVVTGLARAYPGASLIAGLDFALPMLRIAARHRSARSLLPSNDADSQERPGSGAERENRPRSEPAGGATLRREYPGVGAGAAVAYLGADALAIPARGASFDRVTVAYGLRNVADLDGCLAEVLRVLRPGGRLLILEFGKPPNRAVASLYFAYLRAVVPLFGRIFFGDPDTHGYILDSLVRFPSQAELAEILRAAGFSSVRVENPLLGAMGLIVAEIP